MLETLSNFLTNIVDLLSTFFNWVGGLIQDLINLASTVAKAVAAIPNLLGWLPSTLVASLVAGFAIVAAYKILGREG